MKYTYEIEQDQDPQNPRTEWDNLGTILYRKSARYTLGDNGVESEEITETANRDDVICLPVYAYIHSGIALNTTGFSCPWDSGQSGIIYVEKEKVKKEWKVSRVSAKLYKKVQEILRGEIETFAQYLGGDVYGYRILDENGEEVDSCWGFFGRDYCEETAKDTLKYWENKEKKTA